VILTKKSKMENSDPPAGPSCQGCGSPSGTQLCCPECVKLGRTTYFCSQTCFAKNWATHCQLHRLIKQQRELEAQNKIAPDDSNNKVSDALAGNSSTQPVANREQQGVWKRVPHADVGDRVAGNLPAQQASSRNKSQPNPPNTLTPPSHSASASSKSKSFGVALMSRMLKDRRKLPLWLVLALGLAFLMLRTTRTQSTQQSFGAHGTSKVTMSSVPPEIQQTEVDEVLHRIERLSKELDSVRSELKRHGDKLQTIGEELGMKEKWSHRRSEMDILDNSMATASGAAGGGGANTGNATVPILSEMKPNVRRKPRMDAMEVEVLDDEGVPLAK
jgi:hypothetical protein